MSYNSDDPPSDVESTVTPIEFPADRGYGYMLESDELASLDILVDRRREKQKRRHEVSFSKPIPSKSSSDQSDSNSGPPSLSPADTQDIYKELQEINKKLREENKILHQREQAVTERERLVAISQESLHTIADHEIKQQIKEREEQHQEEVRNFDLQLRDKTRENRRLKENFETLKLANDALRKELETLQSQHMKLEKQSVSLQARLTNLQRKQELNQRQPPVSNTHNVQPLIQGEEKQGRQSKPKDTQSARVHKQRSGAVVYEILGVLLDWVSDSHLRQSITDQPTRPLECPIPQDSLHNKCLKILPGLAEVIKDFPNCQGNIYLPCLQFVYWSLLNIEQSQNPQKSSLTSTLRRLGEELYRPRTVKFHDEDRSSSLPLSPTRPEKGDKSKETVFFRSSDLHSRFLSSLIILKTLSQADVLAHVFDSLRNDLKTNTGKDLFLYYQTTPVVLPFLRPVHKTFLSSAVDIYLQMCMESAYLQQFLDSCSNEVWFRTVAMTLRSPNLDTQILEKISIILQKLSKMKCNKKYFEVYTIISVIQELVRGSANDSAFLNMNLKSILLNLGIPGKQAVSRIT